MSCPNTFQMSVTFLFQSQMQLLAKTELRASESISTTNLLCPCVYFMPHRLHYVYNFTNTTTN